jgi:hypothetical protein
VFDFGERRILAAFASREAADRYLSEFKGAGAAQAEPAPPQARSRDLYMVATGVEGGPVRYSVREPAGDSWRELAWFDNAAAASGFLYRTENADAPAAAPPPARCEECQTIVDPDGRCPVAKQIHRETVPKTRPFLGVAWRFLLAVAAWNVLLDWAIWDREQDQ